MGPILEGLFHQTSVVLKLVVIIELGKSLRGSRLGNILDDQRELDIASKLVAIMK